MCLPQPGGCCEQVTVPSVNDVRIPTDAGRLYLAFLPDAFSRKLIDLTMSGSMLVLLCKKTYSHCACDRSTGYQLHLVDHGTSPVSLNAAITALKFFVEVTLDRG